MNVKGSIRIAVFALALSTVAIAAPQQWTIYKPGNTGIGGKQVESMRLDPQGKPWVGARYPIQQDGGVAMFDGVRWTNYSTVDNLMPSEYVYAMAFASASLRWFGTDVGLVRHFGDHFDLFNSSNSPLPKNFIRSIQVDTSGAVWMVYWDPLTIFTGVARFNGTTWTIWPHNTALGLSDATQLDKLVVAPNGHVWVGSNSTAGLSRWDGTRWTKVLPGSGATAPFNPFLGRDGRLWVLTGNSVRVLDGSTWITRPLPQTEGLLWMSLHALPDGTYFVGNWQGTLAYNNGTGWQSMVTPAQVAHIETNAAGELWWVSFKRLYKFVSWGNWRVFHSGNTGLTEYFANSTTFDTAGKLWVGTAGGGACSFSDGIWRGYNPYNDGSEPWGLPTDNVAEIVGTKDGSIWIATGNSAARWNGSTWKQYGYGFMKDDIAEGSGGAIHATWDINTDSGYGTFNGADFLRTSLVGAPLYGSDPRDIFIDSGGKFFISTQTGLLTNESGTWLRIDMSPIIGADWVVPSCAKKAPNGDLWVGTDQGLARRRNGAWTVFKQSNSGLPANAVTSLAFRGDGLLAVGAFNASVWPYYGGVATFNGTTWKTFTYANSPIQHEQVDDVSFDPAGNLWIVSQSEGIAKIALGTGTGAALSSVGGPGAVPAGLSAQLSVTLSGPAPAGGVTVTLASGSPLVTVPSSVLVPQGAVSNTFTAKTSKVAADTVVGISATSGGTTKSTSLKLLFSDAGYYGQSTPLQMTPGQKASVSITFRNMGSSTWTDGAGFRLASRNPADNKTFGTNRLRLNPVLSVQPGELGNFMGTITAPLTPGKYLWQWKPLLNGVGTFGEETIPMYIEVQGAANNAGFASQTVPSVVKAGATFSASVTMTNTGTTTWTHLAGYRMQSRNPADNVMWGTNRMFLPSAVSVLPGQSFTFSRQFKAPTTPGTYNFQWKMLLNGTGSFGAQSPNVAISVVP